MEVYVIRHTPVTIENTCYGQSDVPLAASHLQDAEEIAQKLPDDFDAIYCSPSQRCKDLAEILKLKDVICENDLMEMNFGDWEGKLWDNINTEELNKWMVDFVNIRTPNGENLQDLYQRVQSFLDKLRQKSPNKVLLITHAGVIRCIWAYLLEIPLQNIFKIRVGYKEVFIFKLSENKERDYIKQVK